MLRPLLGFTETDLERQLLQKSVGLLEDDRHECSDCHRTPLIGEKVHRFSRGEIVCDLCRERHPGEPESSDLVRHFERGHAVKLRPRFAA
jgi:hypothetical protein